MGSRTGSGSKWEWEVRGGWFFQCADTLAATPPSLRIALALFPLHRSVNGFWKETGGTKGAKRRYAVPCPLSYPDTGLTICRSQSSSDA